MALRMQSFSSSFLLSKYKPTRSFIFHEYRIWNALLCFISREEGIRHIRIPFPKLFLFYGKKKKPQGSIFLVSSRLCCDSRLRIGDLYTQLLCLGHNFNPLLRRYRVSNSKTNIISKQPGRTLYFGRIYRVQA